MKKSLLLYLFPLLFCACNYETDPDKLLPWLNEMNLYAGEKVYNVDDSISLVYNNQRRDTFRVCFVEDIYLQICCQGFNSAVLGIHHDGPVTDAGVRCEIANPNDTIALHIWKKGKDKPIISIRIDDIECEPFSEDIDFSQDTLILNDRKGQSVTLVRHIGLTEIKSANGDIWQLQESH